MVPWRYELDREKKREKGRETLWIMEAGKKFRVEIKSAKPLHPKDKTCTSFSAKFSVRSQRLLILAKVNIVLVYQYHFLLLIFSVYLYIYIIIPRAYPAFSQETFNNYKWQPLCTHTHIYIRKRWGFVSKKQRLKSPGTTVKIVCMLLVELWISVNIYCLFPSRKSRGCFGKGGGVVKKQNAHLRAP